MDPGLCWQLVCMYRQMENTSELVDVVRKLGGGRISRRVQQYLLENVVQDEVSNLACFYYWSFIKPVLN